MMKKIDLMKLCWVVTVSGWLLVSGQSGIAADTADAGKRVEGEWIIYRGDQYEIKRISDGKEESTFYNWMGEPLFERSADLKMTAVSDAESKTLIDKAATWEYLAGGQEPDDDSWTGLGFDAEKAGWKSGKAGFGYGDNDDNTVLSDMQNNYTTIFIRKEFEIPAGTDLKRLGLLINYDDGFVIYANGRRLFNSNNISVDEKTGELTVNNHEAGTDDYFSLNEYASAFRTGKNVIAIEGHNTNLPSTDFSLDPQLVVSGSGSFVKTNRKETHHTQRSNWYHKNRTWNGKVDDVAIWERSLSDDEISALWNRGRGTKNLDDVKEGIIGHWPFDGNLNDVSGNGRHAKGVNDPGFAEGKLGQAVNLSGDNQYVTLGGKATDYKPESGSLTIALWFNVNDFDKRWQTLLSIGNNGPADWRIHRQNMSPNISYLGGQWVRNNTKVDDGKMHHLVAVTEKGKEVRLYIDNVLVANSGNNGIGDLGTDEDGWLPAVGANLQGQIDLEGSIEGDFMPSQDSLRVYAKPSVQQTANRHNSGVYRSTSHPEEALRIAARSGDLEKVKALLKSGVNPDATTTNSYTPLAYAASGGHLEVMKHLLANGADVDKASRFKKTPLLVAVGSPHVDAVKLLLAEGADIDARQAQGGGCIHEAAFWGQPEMLTFLLKDQKVDPNMRGGNGQTGIHHALWPMMPGLAEENRGNLECVKVLLDHGTNPDLRWNRASALQMAKNNHLKEAAELLSE